MARRRRLPKFLTPEQCEALARTARSAIEAARTPGKRTAANRDLVMLQTGSLEGLRVSELCNLALEDLDDLDLPNAQIAVRRGKGDKDRYVPVSPGLAPLLKTWLGARKTGYVFPGPKGRRLSERTFRRRLDALAKSAGITKRVHPHLLRHTFATTYLEVNGENALREVQELLGHASLQTTEVYLHVKSERLKRGIDRMPVH